MTKKKKILIACISVLCCAIVIVSVTLGIIYGTKRKPIDMATYFNSAVKSNVSGNLPLNYFTGSKPSTNTNAYARHTTLTFSGELNWIGSMYLERVYFYFYCNTTKKDMQIIVSVTGLKDGNTDNTTLPAGSHEVQQIIGVNSTAGKGVLVAMDINQTVLSAAAGANLELTISLANETALANADFMWTIYSLQIYGEHKQ